MTKGKSYYKAYTKKTKRKTKKITNQHRIGQQMGKRYANDTLPSKFARRFGKLARLNADKIPSARSTNMVITPLKNKQWVYAYISRVNQSTGRHEKIRKYK